MTQKGGHTWDLVIHYHCCPSCGNIIESRQDFEYLLGEWIKEIICEKCDHAFKLTKKRRPAFGPLIGNPQPKEIDWT
jgi:hypothetical protein